MVAAGEPLTSESRLIRTLTRVHHLRQPGDEPWETLFCVEYGSFPLLGRPLAATGSQTTGNAVLCRVRHFPSTGFTTCGNRETNHGKSLLCVEYGSFPLPGRPLAATGSRTTGNAVLCRVRHFPSTGLTTCGNRETNHGKRCFV